MGGNSLSELAWLKPLLQIEFYRLCECESKKQCSFYCRDCMGLPFCEDCYTTHINMKAMEVSECIDLQAGQELGFGALRICWMFQIFNLIFAILLSLFISIEKESQSMKIALIIIMAERVINMKFVAMNYNVPHQSL
ncbi:hypothetical protein REPUB_Repub06bG0121200 [Reevesia pubescens]